MWIVNSLMPLESRHQQQSTVTSNALFAERCSEKTCTFSSSRTVGPSAKIMPARGRCQGRTGWRSSIATASFCTKPEYSCIYVAGDGYYWKAKVRRESGEDKASSGISAGYVLRLVLYACLRALRSPRTPIVKSVSDLWSDPLRSWTIHFGLFQEEGSFQVRMPVHHAYVADPQQYFTCVRDRDGISRMKNASRFPLCLGDAQSVLATLLSHGGICQVFSVRTYIKYLPTPDSELALFSAVTNPQPPLDGQAGVVPRMSLRLCIIFLCPSSNYLAVGTTAEGFVQRKPRRLRIYKIEGAET